MVSPKLKRPQSISQRWSHTVVSKTQGGTIGTAPWNDSTKRMRTVTSSLMTRPAIQRSSPMLDIETSALVDGLYQGSRKGTIEVDPRIYCQRQALNLTLMWCYGTRIDSVQDPLLHKILHVAHSVSSWVIMLFISVFVTQRNSLTKQITQIPVDQRQYSGLCPDISVSTQEWEDQNCFERSHSPRFLAQRAIPESG